MDDLKERKLPLRVRLDRTQSSVWLLNNVWLALQEAKKEIDEFKAGITDPFKVPQYTYIFYSNVVSFIF